MTEQGGRLDPARLTDEYRAWVERIGKMHEGTAPATNDEATLHRPHGTRADWRVGLLTTAGAYVEGQPAYDVDDPHGDASIRVIPDDTDPADLRFAHSHYDTTQAEADPNVVLPLDPLHAMVADGEVRAASPVHVGMMGWNPDPTAVRDRAAPAVVDLFRAAEVDVVIMSPG